MAEGGRGADKLTEKDFDFSSADPLYLQQWSCVPVVCSLSEAESLDCKAKKCQFIVPRQSYLYDYAYHETITNSLSNFAKGSGCRWFSYRSLQFSKADVFLPLPVQHPVHVLCDMIAAERRYPTPPPAFRAPLVIRLHFSEPKKEDFEAMCSAVPPMSAMQLPTWEQYLQRYQAVLRLDTIRCGYRWMRHTVKQSLMARFGSCQALYELEKHLPKLAADVFNAVIDNQAEPFWRARTALEQCGDMRSKRDQTHLVVVHYNAWQSVTILCKSSNQKLGLFLKENVEMFAELEREQCHSTQPAHILFVQGVSPLLSTPMDALLELFTSCDLTLHIVLKHSTCVEQFLSGV